MKNILAIIIYMNLFLTVFAQKTDKNFKKGNEIKVKIENTLDLPRKEEVIELDWALLTQKNAQIMLAQFIVINSTTAEQLPYQIINNESGKPEKLLVQISLTPLSNIELSIKKGTPNTFKTKTFGRLVPERMDDFAWENDKIAFRMYGPALQATGEISSGIDVWAKRTPEMVIDKWYKLNDYHKDNGEGLDFYKVGPTLGAGGIAPFANGKLCYSKNWASYKLLTTGALRTVFELSYQPWNFNGIEISETKRITLNAGSQLNQVEVIYDTKGLDTIPVVTGIIKRNENGVLVMDEQEGFMSYWEPANKKNGTTGIGIIVPDNKGMTVAENHLLAFSNAINKKPFKYFQGACWDKAGEIKNESDWTIYLKEYALKLHNPLIISF